MARERYYELAGMPTSLVLLHGRLCKMVHGRWLEYVMRVGDSIVEVLHSEPIQFCIDKLDGDIEEVQKLPFAVSKFDVSIQYR